MLTMILKGIEIKISLIDLNLKSLKEKRSLTKSILAKTRRRYNVSINEIGDFESLDFLLIGLASVGTSNKNVDKSLEQCIKFIESTYLLEIIEINRYY